VTEVAIGAPLSDVLSAAGINESGPCLVGGYFGRWLSPSAVSTALVSHESLGSLGASLGAGVVVALGPDGCGVAETARVVRYLAGETAQQCGPCVFGLASIADGLDALVRSGDRLALHDIRRWTAQVRGRGACRHPDGAMTLVDSALDVFGAEIERHRLCGPCPAAVAGATLPVPHIPVNRGWR
jgi:NADH:ubiquinone oxidoreductase subunit F (NADH-binding)